jgi:hypothetical protein
LTVWCGCMQSYYRAHQLLVTSSDPDDKPAVFAGDKLV